MAETSVGREIWTAFVALLTHDAVKKGLEVILKALGEKVVDNVTPADLRDWRHRLTGSISLDDEHMFLRTQAVIAESDPVAVEELNRKLKANLTSEFQDRYRLMLLGKHDLSDEVENRECLEHMIQMMTHHAYMGEEEWENLKEIINLQKQEAEPRFERLVNFIGTNTKVAFETMYNAAKKIGVDLYDAAVKIGMDAESLLKIREAGNTINRDLRNRAAARRGRLAELRNKSTRWF